MNLALVFGSAALVVNIIGYVPYIRGIFTSAVKPQRVTWGIWCILTVIGAVNQVANHGGYSILFMGSSAILASTVFVLSVRRGLGGAGRFDQAVLAASALLAVAWALSHNTRTSTVIAVLIDGTAALPTLVKAYRRPHTELYLQWVLAGVGGLLTMLSITNPDLILYIYPIYIAAMNAAIVAAKFLGERRQKKL